MGNTQTKIVSDILSEEKLNILVGYFVKVIIAQSPVYSVLTGGNEAGKTKMIWGRGELIFALHHRFVNLTSGDYLNTPLHTRIKGWECPSGAKWRKRV